MIAAAKRQTIAQNGPDRRRALRVKGHARVMVNTLRGPLPGEVLDASLTGLRLRCRSNGMIPNVARFRFVDFDFEVQARKVWGRANISGWKIIYDAGQTGRLLAAIADQHSDRVRNVVPAEVHPVRRR